MKSLYELSLVLNDQFLLIIQISSNLSLFKFYLFQEGPLSADSVFAESHREDLIQTAWLNNKQSLEHLIQIQF